MTRTTILVLCKQMLHKFKMFYLFISMQMCLMLFGIRLTVSLNFLVFKSSIQFSLKLSFVSAEGGLKVTCSIGQRWSFSGPAQQTSTRDGAIHRPALLTQYVEKQQSASPANRLAKLDVSNDDVWWYRYEQPALTILNF